MLFIRMTVEEHTGSFSYSLDAFGSLNKKSQNGNRADIFGANLRSVVPSLVFFFFSGRCDDGLYEIIKNIHWLQCTFLILYILIYGGF
jgi:hypothetical protein